MAVLNGQRRAPVPRFGTLTWNESDSAATSVAKHLRLPTDVTLNYVNGYPNVNFYALKGKETNLKVVIGRDWLKPGQEDPIAKAHQALVALHAVDPEFTGEVGPLVKVAKADGAYISAFTRDDLMVPKGENDFVSYLYPSVLDEEELHNQSYCPEEAVVLVDRILANYLKLEGRVPVIPFRTPVSGAVLYSKCTGSRNEGGYKVAGKRWFDSYSGLWRTTPDQIVGGTWKRTYAYSAHILYSSELQIVARDNLKAFLLDMLAPKVLFDNSNTKRADVLAALTQRIDAWLKTNY
jgi:hypothetical protein